MSKLFHSLFGRLPLLLTLLVIAACTTSPRNSGDGFLTLASDTPTPASDPAALVSPFPTRPEYLPGELVDYTAQTGDTLPALAARFNTSVEEILSANPIIPRDATTMPPGLPMKIPIYYRPFWGSQFQIIPDSQFVNGPAAIGFDTEAFVSQQPGWLKDFSDYVGGQNRSGAGLVDYVAMNFSISPRLLLALLEFQTGALTQLNPPSNLSRYPLGFVNPLQAGLYLQLVQAADLLNDGYYRWRTGHLLEFDRPDGTIEQIDPWQNAATASLMNYFNELLPQEDYPAAIGENGFAKTFADLFGDPWANDQPHIPGSLQQPIFPLPFEPGKEWAFTGGPHTGWGNFEPYAALDFAPPTMIRGCNVSSEWATAIAPGVIVRSDRGIAMLDLDMDGDARTGWVIFYLHLATYQRAPVGAILDTGDPVGHPSCEGGSATGSHVHIARLYNGEWIPADGVLAFVMDGWTPHSSGTPYEGTLTRFDRTLIACACASQHNQFTSSIPPKATEIPSPTPTP